MEEQTKDYLLQESDPMEEQTSEPVESESTSQPSESPVPDTITYSPLKSDLRTILKRKRASSTCSSSTVAGYSSPARVKQDVRPPSTYSNTNSQNPQLKRARLFVGNINPNVTRRNDLVKLFSNYGDVLGVSVHNGFAFIQMDEERAANRAINHLHSIFFKGVRIDVEFSEAAIQAGAKFTKFCANRQREKFISPPRPNPSAPRQPAAHSTLFSEEHLKEREARLARILEMEREIARLRAGDAAVLAGSRQQRPHLQGSYFIQEDRVDRPSPHRITSEAFEEQRRPHIPFQRGQGPEKPHPPPSPQTTSDRWQCQPPFQVCYNGETTERPLVQVFLP